MHAMVLPGPPSAQIPINSNQNTTSNISSSSSSNNGFNYRKDLSSFSASHRRFNRPHPVLETIQESTDFATTSTLATTTAPSTSASTILSHNPYAYYDVPPLSASTSSSCSSPSTLASPSFGNFRVSHSEPLLLHYSPEDSFYTDPHRPQVSRRLSFSSIDQSRRSLTSFRNSNQQIPPYAKHSPSAKSHDFAASLQSPGLPLNLVQRSPNSSSSPPPPTPTSTNNHAAASNNTNLINRYSTHDQNQLWSSNVRHAYTDSRDSALEAFFFPFKYDDNVSNNHDNDNSGRSGSNHSICPMNKHVGLSMKATQPDSSKLPTFSETCNTISLDPDNDSDHLNEINHQLTHTNIDHIASPFSTPSPNSYYSPGRDVDTDTGTDLDTAGVFFSPPNNSSLAKSFGNHQQHQHQHQHQHPHQVNSNLAEVQKRTLTLQMNPISSSGTKQITSPTTMTAATKAVFGTIDSPFRTSSDTGYSTLESNGPLTPTRPNSPAYTVQNNLESNVFACEPFFTESKTTFSDPDSSKANILPKKPLPHPHPHPHHHQFISRSKWDSHNNCNGNNRESISTLSSSCSSLSYRSLASGPDPSYRVLSANLTTMHVDPSSPSAQSLKDKQVADDKGLSARSNAPVLGRENDQNNDTDNSSDTENENDNDNDDDDDAQSTDSLLDDDLDGLPSVCSLSVFPLPPNTKLPLPQISSPGSYSTGSTMTSSPSCSLSPPRSPSPSPSLSLNNTATFEVLDCDRTIRPDLSLGQLAHNNQNEQYQDEKQQPQPQVDGQEPKQEQTNHEKGDQNRHSSETMDNSDNSHQEQPTTQMSAAPNTSDSDKENDFTVFQNPNPNGNGQDEDEEEDKDKKKHKQHANGLDDNISVLSEESSSRNQSPESSPNPSQKPSLLRQLTLANRLSTAGQGQYARAKSRLRSSFLFSSTSASTRPQSRNPMFPGPDSNTISKSASDSKIASAPTDTELEKLNGFLAPPSPNQPYHRSTMRAQTAQPNDDAGLNELFHPSRQHFQQQIHPLPLSAPPAPTPESKWPTHRINESVSSSSNSSYSTTTKRPDSRRSSQLYAEKGHGPLGRVVPGSQSLFYTQSHSVASTSSLPLHSSTPSPKYYQQHFGFHSTSKLVGNGTSSISSADSLRRSRSPEVFLNHYSRYTPSPTFRNNISPSYQYRYQRQYQYQDTPCKPFGQRISSSNGHNHHEQEHYLGTPQQQHSMTLASSPTRSVDSYHTATQNSTIHGTPNLQEQDGSAVLDQEEHQQSQPLPPAQEQDEPIEWIQYGYAL